MSIGGGIENAFHAGADVGCDCLQIFVKNNRQWSTRALSDESVEAFRAAAESTRLWPVVAHATYLLNPASPDRSLRRRTVNALADEIRRCTRLAVPYLVLHPGAHMDTGINAGIRRIVATLDRVHELVAESPTRILLETTAGQGSSIGHRIEQLGRIIANVRMPDRLGVCVDTCHVFAAGYDIRDRAGYQRLTDELSEHVGLQRVQCIHVNDSMRECGSRVDRHAHIGQGKIGLAGFRHLLNDPGLASVPRILETPNGRDGRGTDLDRVNLKRLRRLVEPR